MDKIVNCNKLPPKQTNKIYRNVPMKLNFLVNICSRIFAKYESFLKPLEITKEPPK